MKFLATRQKVNPFLQITSEVSDKLMLWDSSSHSPSEFVSAMICTHTHHKCFM